jgi:hypothetical protein
VLAGVDVRRDAPRNLDLKHLDDQGVFQPVTSNSLTLSFVEPFFPWTALSASISTTTWEFGRKRFGWTIRTSSVRRIPSTDWLH